MTRPVVPEDEQFHPVDPDDRNWNESWFFSWIDLDGGPSGFFRVGVLPNQGRAMLWSFVHAGDRWLGTEESRLSFDDLDLTDGIAYDRWGLSFAWKPTAPLEAGHFTFAGSLLERTGVASAAYRPVIVDLTTRATAAPIPTGTGHDDRESPYDASRFEQPFSATGSVVIDGATSDIRAGAHRDKSWGPRTWRVAFTLGDLQAEDRQLYFVGGSFPGRGGGFVRDRDAPVDHVAALEGSTVDYHDDRHTIGGGHLRFQGRGAPLDVTLRAIAPSVTFDMAHTCEVPEHWLYYRTLVEADVDGWGGPCRGWFETSRYGTS